MKKLRGRIWSILRSGPVFLKLLIVPLLRRVATFGKDLGEQVPELPMNVPDYGAGHIHPEDVILL